MQRGERQGPCAHPGCKMPHGTIKTQWTFIPESFQGWEDLAEGHNNCVCRSRDCRDFVGLPPLSGQVKRLKALLCSLLCRAPSLFGRSTRSGA